MAQKTAVERHFETRIAELEQGAQRGSSISIWGYVTSILPVPLLVFAAVVFVLFHGWEYYNKGQQEAAQTRIEKAEAAIGSYDATTANLTIDDLPAQSAKLKAELEKLRANIANTQAQAEKARAEADAATEKSGYSTLAERAVRAQLIISELKAAAARMGAQSQANFNNKTGFMQGALDGLCKGNRYAALIDCPLSYVEEVDPVAAQKIRDKIAAEDAAQKAEEKAKRQKLKALNLKGGEVFMAVANGKAVRLTYSVNMDIRNDSTRWTVADDIIRVLAIHKDREGIDDFYQIKFYPTSKAHSDIFWTSAPNFNEQRSFLRLLPAAQVSNYLDD